MRDFRRQPGERRPYRSLLASCHGDRRLRRDERRGLLYEPKSHTLLPHLKDDIRAQTGLQDFVATAPLNLVYAAHGERMTDICVEDRRVHASVDAGFIGQNVYLFCGSEGSPRYFGALSICQSWRESCSFQNSSSLVCADRGLSPRLNASAPRERGGGDVRHGLIC